MKDKLIDLLLAFVVVTLASYGALYLFNTFNKPKVVPERECKETNIQNMDGKLYIVSVCKHPLN